MRNIHALFQLLLLGKSHEYSAINDQERTIMKEHIATYFTAEKQESLLFILAGIVALAVSVWLWMAGHRLKAMAYPLAAIALIQLVVGATVLLRSDAQAQTLTQQAATQPQQFVQAEAARMATVMKNFVLYRYIEIALVIIGVLLVALWPRTDWIAAVGVGLALQSALMLTLDLFAEARGQTYLHAVAGFAQPN
jgi:uncharacterized membrane protein YiaA